MTTPRGSNVSVLVADDDPLVRRVLRLALATQGYRVDEACDAIEAMSLAQHGPDLIVLDINMPGGTVHETLGELRDRLPHVPILVLSGEPSPPADLPENLAEFARKPIDLDDLLSRVRRLLEDAAGTARA